MRRVGVALVIALMALTGCGGAPTKVETPPPPAVQAPSQNPSQAPAPQPAQTPAPAPSAAVDLCDQKLPLAERQKLLPAAVIDMQKNGTALGNCLRVDRIEGENNAMLIVGHVEKGGMLAGIGWRTDAGEVKAAVIQAPARGWEVADTLGPVSPTKFSNGRLSVLLMEVSSGTGGYKRLFQVAENPDGTFITTALTDVYEKAWFQFIAPDLVLLSFRGNPGPQAWECNACMTANNQILWRWDGKQLTKLGERAWSEPYLTVNLLLGALKTGETKSAAKYVTDPALVEKAAKLIGTDVMSWRGDVWNEAYGKIQDAERTAWDLLPAGVRTTVPQTTYDETVTKDSQKVVFHLTRTDRGWLVSGIN